MKISYEEKIVEEYDGWFVYRKNFCYGPFKSKKKAQIWARSH